MVNYVMPEIPTVGINRDQGMSDCVIGMVLTVSRIQAIRI